MVKIGCGGEIDIHKIQRLVRSDEVLVGYPDGIMHPAVVGHKTTKSGRPSKKRAFSILLSTVQNSDLARWLHEGTSRIPARPFLYQGIMSDIDQIRKAIKQYLEAEIKGLPTNLSKVGALAVGAVQKFVRGGYYRGALPNAQRTKDVKGSDMPLIDTGFMLNSTTYVIRNVKKLPDSRQKMQAPT